MELYDFIERFLFFLLPGFIFVFLFCYMTGRNMRSEKLTTAYVLVASTFSYLIGNTLLTFLNSIFKCNYKTIDVSKILTGTKKTISTPAIIASLVASFGLCIICVWIVDHDIFFSLLHKFKITHMTGNGEVWSDLFDDESTIIVRDGVTGNTYFGQVSSYSTGLVDEKAVDNILREIKLEEVTVYPGNSYENKYKMKSVYLCRKPTELTIEVGNYNEESEKNDKKNRV